jgi:hypothetical protein
LLFLEPAAELDGGGAAKGLAIEDDAGLGAFWFAELAVAVGVDGLGDEFFGGFEVVVGEGVEGCVGELLELKVSGDAAGDSPGGFGGFPTAGNAEDEGLGVGGESERKKEPAQKDARGLCG